MGDSAMSFGFLCIASSFGALTFALSVVLYRIARPYFPVTVNCWFCNKDSKVPYGNKSCWDCPFCEQYNGFSEDGDYNKAIPAQSKENLNHPVCIENRNSRGFTSVPPVLCEACNRNQLLKVRQLANFVPYNEANYDMEVEGYKYHLEQIYRLCRPCQLNLDQVLENQNRNFQDDLNNTSVRKVYTPDSSYSVLENSLCSSHLSCQLAAPWHVKLLRWSSLLCAVSLFITALIILFEHSHSVIEPSQWLPNAIMIYCTALHKGVKLVILLGLVTGLLAIYRFGKHSLHMCDAVSCMTWLLTLAVYSNSITIQLKPEDMFLLQAISATANMVVCLWGSFCPRYERTSSKRVHKKRRHLNLSGASLDSTSPVSDSNHSTLSDETERRSVASAPDARRKVATEDGHLDKFETMSLGAPSRQRRSPGVFAIKNNNPLMQGPSPKKSTLESLRQKKPIISPARFKPTISSNNSAGRTPAPRKLFSSSQWKGGLFSSPSQDRDGSESVFSVPRTNQDFSDSEDESVSRNSHSSYCPVGSTQHSNEGDCQENDRKPRSIFTRIFLGVSLGLNIALVMYFTIDFSNLPTDLGDIKDKIVNFTSTVYGNSEPWKDNVISLYKSGYAKMMDMFGQLTQEIPGEATNNNNGS